jgi:predicted MPP superfamily phosphohydrolase
VQVPVISSMSLVLVALASSACVAVVVEANDDADGESDTGSGDTGDADGSGDGDPGDGDGDGDGDGGGDGDGDGEPESFRVVVLADCHVPGITTTDDEEAIFVARERLLATRDQIAAIDPPPAFVVVVGDMVHNAHVSNELLWYQTNPNAFADVVEIFDSLSMPVYPVFGDSDYDVPDSPQSFSHLLFANFFATDPHSSVDHLGWRFVFANSQEGLTFAPDTLPYDPTVGSFGSNQLGWIGEQLSAGMPTVLFSHFPLFSLAVDETVDGPYTDLEQVLTETGDSVALVLSGHTHVWTNLPATYAAPHMVLGGTLHDSDNFLLIEFTSHALQYEILDLGKVQWGSQEADTWVYDGTPMPGP